MISIRTSLLIVLAICASCGKSDTEPKRRDEAAPKPAAAPVTTPPPAARVAEPEPDPEPEPERKCKAAPKADLCTCLVRASDVVGNEDATCDFAKLGDALPAPIAGHRLLQVQMPPAMLKAYLVRDLPDGRLAAIALVEELGLASGGDLSVTLDAFKQVKLGTVDALWIETSSAAEEHLRYEADYTLRGTNLTLLRLPAGAGTLQIPIDHVEKGGGDKDTNFAIDVKPADGAVIAKAKRGKPPKDQLGRRELPQ